MNCYELLCYFLYVNAEKTAIIPDCIFQMTTKNNNKWLYMSEIYRGHTTKRVHQQLDRYLIVLEKGSINTAYDYFRPIPVLIICETKRSMRSLMNRLKNDTAFSQIEKYFLFRVIESVLFRKDNAHQTCKESNDGVCEMMTDVYGKKGEFFCGVRPSLLLLGFK